MSALPQLRRRSLWVEYALMFAIVAGLIHTVWFLHEYGYLPQPWFYEPSGTFMDWYSLAYSAHLPGAYDIERSIYPPLSFVIMKVFGVASCYRNAIGEPSRDCDYWGIYALTGCLAINVLLTFLAFRRYDRASYIPRAFAVALGYPMLHAFERGNLIIFCYSCLLLAYGPLLKSARLRWFFGGMLINFKVYMIGAVIAPLLRRRWLQVEVMILWTIAIYVATWAILGEGSPGEIVQNVMDYSSGFGASKLLDIWFPGSLIPIIGLLKGETFPINTIMDSNIAENLLLVLTTFGRAMQLIIVIAAVCTWLRPEAVPTRRIVYFAIALPLTVSEAGGYTEIFLLFFVFMESWRGVGRPTAITLSYILCLPWEIVVSKLPPIVRWSWLANADVIAEYGVGVGSFLRPIIMLIVTVCLASVTIRDVWADIHGKEHQKRWRYRRDAYIFRGEWHVP